MTTIAWDGSTLAADRQCEIDYTRHRVSKIRACKRKGQTHLMFSSGYMGHTMALFDWYENVGDDIYKGWPEFQKDKDDWQPLYIITPSKKILRFGKTPHPYKIDSKFIAIGSGSHFATAFMHVGYSAEEAVKMTAEFDPSTNAEIDTLIL